MVLMIFVMLVVMLHSGRCLGRSGALLLGGRGDGCGCLCKRAERKQPGESGDSDLLVHR